MHSEPGAPAQLGRRKGSLARRQKLERREMIELRQIDPLMNPNKARRQIIRAGDKVKTHRPFGKGAAGWGIAPKERGYVLMPAIDLDAGERRHYILRTAFEDLQKAVLGEDKHAGEIDGSIPSTGARQQARKIVAREHVGRFARIQNLKHNLLRHFEPA